MDLVVRVRASGDSSLTSVFRPLLAASAAAPSAPSSVSLINSLGSLTISVSATAPSDFQAYRYRIIQTSPSAADVVFDSPSALETYSLYAQATYQVGVKILDVYGQLSTETLSSATIVDTLTISALRADIIYSDSDGNSDATLHVPLSNAVLGSGGITYATTATWNKWVRGERPMLDRYRTLTLSMAPASGTSSWYLRVSSDASTWTYYAGPVTGNVVTLVANAAAAQAAAISAATLGGTTTSKVVLPATIEARFVEVWVRNATPANTTIYEFYPRRLVEADDIVVQNLSSISADIGTITAGTINSVTINSTTINSSTINAGGGDIVLNSAGMSITRDTSSTVGARPNLPGYVPGATHSMRFVNGATVHGYVGQTSDTYSSPATVVNELLIAVPAVTGQQSNITLFADHTSQGSEVRLISQSSAELAYLEVMASTGAGISYIRAVAESVYLESGVNVGTASGAASGQVATSGSMAVGASINSAVRLFAKGIGTTSATYCFNAQNSAGTNIIYCRDDGLSNFISSAWSSDRRHKDAIRDIDEADLTRFRQLDPKWYIRTNGPGGPEYGLIAQDVQPVFPEWVVTDPDGSLSLRYNDAIPLLMAEVRLLRARVAALEEAPV
mgnify:FL=1